MDAQPVLIAPERARPASEAAQPVPSPRPTVGGIIGGGSAALAAIIALGYMGLVQAEEIDQIQLQAWSGHPPGHFRLPQRLRSASGPTLGVLVPNFGLIGFLALF